MSESDESDEEELQLSLEEIDTQGIHLDNTEEDDIKRVDVYTVTKNDVSSTFLVTFTNCKLYECHGMLYNDLESFTFEYEPPDKPSLTKFRRRVLDAVTENYDGTLHAANLYWTLGTTNFYFVPKGTVRDMNLNLKELNRLAYICDKTDCNRQSEAAPFLLQSPTFYNKTKTVKTLRGVSLNYDLTEYTCEYFIVLQQGFNNHNKYQNFDARYGGVQLRQCETVKKEELEKELKSSSNRIFIQTQLIFYQEKRTNDNALLLFNDYIHPNVQWIVRRLRSLEDLNEKSGVEIQQYFKVNSDIDDDTFLWSKIDPCLSNDNGYAVHIHTLQHITVNETVCTSYVFGQTVSCVSTQLQASKRIKAENHTLPVFGTGQIPILNTRRTTRTRKRKRLVPLLPWAPAANLLLPAAPPSFVSVRVEDNCLMSFSACG